MKTMARIKMMIMPRPGLKATDKEGQSAHPLVRSLCSGQMIAAEIILGCANKMAKRHLLQNLEDWGHSLPVSVQGWLLPSHCGCWPECI